MSLRDLADWDEGILDTAARIERERPLTVDESVELALAWADFVEATKRLAAIAARFGGSAE